MNRILITLAVLAAAAGARAQSSAPIILNHSGRLLDGTDAPVNGSKTLKFAISKNAQKPVDTETFEWQESYDLILKAGIYAVELGSTANSKTAIPPAAIGGDGARFLVVIVDAVELSPRMRLGTVPFAQNAQTLGGHPVDDFALKADLATAKTALQGGVDGVTTRVKALEDAGYLTTTSAATTFETIVHAAATFHTKDAFNTAIADYETSAHASATYETAGHASDTFETKVHATDTFETKAHATSTFATSAAVTASLANYDTAAVASTKYLAANGGVISGDLDLGTSQLANVGYTLEAEAIRISSGPCAEGTGPFSSGGKKVVCTSSGAAGKAMTHTARRQAGTYNVLLRAAVNTIAPADPTIVIGTLSVKVTPDSGSAVTYTLNLTTRDFKTAGDWWLFPIRNLQLIGAGTITTEFTWVNGKGVDMELDNIHFAITTDDVRRIYTASTGKKYSLDGFYCGSTPGTNGAFSETVGSTTLTSWQAGKAKCEKACSSSSAHMCDSIEMTRSMQVGVVGTTVTGWMGTGILSLLGTGYPRDCGGWIKTDNTTNQGLYWYPQNGSYNGMADNAWCSDVRPIVCCD